MNEHAQEKSAHTTTRCLTALPAPREGVEALGFWEDPEALNAFSNAVNKTWREKKRCYFKNDLNSKKLKLHETLNT